MGNCQVESNQGFQIQNQLCKNIKSIYTEEFGKLHELADTIDNQYGGRIKILLQESQDNIVQYKQFIQNSSQSFNNDFAVNNNPLEKNDKQAQEKNQQLYKEKLQFLENKSFLLQQNNKLFALKTVVCNNEQEVTQLEYQALNYKKRQHNNLISIRKTLINNNQNLCGEMHIFNYLLDYENYTLEKLLYEKKILGEKFKLKHLAQLGIDILQALMFLQNNGVYHGGIQPKNIYVKYNLSHNNIISSNSKFMDQKQQLQHDIDYNYKLLDLLLFNGGTNYERLIKEQQTQIYLSPEIFQWFIFKEQIGSCNFEKDKSDIFCLGLCLLEMGLQEDIQRIYIFQEGKVSSEFLENSLKRIGSLYGEQFQNLLKSMLEINIQERIEFQQAYDELKKLQNSQSSFSSVQTSTTTIQKQSQNKINNRKQQCYFDGEYESPLRSQRKQSGTNIQQGRTKDQNIIRHKKAHTEIKLISQVNNTFSGPVTSAQQLQINQSQNHEQQYQRGNSDSKNINSVQQQQEKQQTFNFLSNETNTTESHNYSETKQSIESISQLDNNNNRNNSTRSNATTTSTAQNNNSNRNKVFSVQNNNSGSTTGRSLKQYQQRYSLNRIPLKAESRNNISIESFRTLNNNNSERKQNIKQQDINNNKNNNFKKAFNNNHISQKVNQYKTISNDSHIQNYSNNKSNACKNKNSLVKKIFNNFVKNNGGNIIDNNDDNKQKEQQQLTNSNFNIDNMSQNSQRVQQKSMKNLSYISNRSSQGFFDYQKQWQQQQNQQQSSDNLESNTNINIISFKKNSSAISNTNRNVTSNQDSIRKRKQSSCLFQQNNGSRLGNNFQNHYSLQQIPYQQQQNQQQIKQKRNLSQTSSSSQQQQQQQQQQQSYQQQILSKYSSSNSEIENISTNDVKHDNNINNNSQLLYQYQKDNNKLNQKQIDIKNSVFKQKVYTKNYFSNKDTLMSQQKQQSQSSYRGSVNINNF